MNPFKWCDRWLCLHLRPLSLRLRWHQLWIRRDEFHVSLQSDPALLESHTTSDQTYEYASDLVRRRQIAHRRDEEQTNKALPRSA